MTRYPLLFHPLYQPRVWGGRTLEARFRRSLPPGPVGESWELTDRPEAVSIVANGPLAGVDLHTLWTGHPELFSLEPKPDSAAEADPALGPDQATCVLNRRSDRTGAQLEPERPDRFPLLIKLLDCQEALSVQVHPDPAAAARLGGESKAELWVLLDASPDAEIYAGLRRGVTQAAFEAALERGGGQVVPMLHRLHPRTGDAMLIPPGRLHAIGAGNLVCEVQQNADTTYRVYDWDRPGLDGAPRSLHRAESLTCLDFDDFEPDFLPVDAERLLEHPPFRVTRTTLDRPARPAHPAKAMVFIVTSGEARFGDVQVEAGRCVLVPAGMAELEVVPLGGPCQVLVVDWSG